jgi:glycosyltransferase involved in cell wall biosynthesis
VSARCRVLQFVPDLSLGGAERMAVHLVRHLDPERFETALVSLFDPVGGDLDDLLKQEDRRVWYLGKRLGFDLRMFGAIRRVLREFDPHVVHTHTITLRYVFPPAWMHGVPARFHTIHSTAEKEAGSWVWLRRLAFRCGVEPVAIADEVARGVRKLYGIDGAPNIPNGIPVDEYAEPRIARDTWRASEGLSPDDFVFVSVGRLAQGKNQALAIRALSRMSRCPGAVLLFAGEGPDDTRDALTGIAHACGVGDRVRFLGRRTDIPDLLGASDAFVLSSDFEGNPLTVLEAMAAGLPVASTAVGGIPELVEHGAGGLLTPAGDAEALAGSLDALAGDDDSRSRMGAAARDTARARFDVSAMASGYARLYLERLGDQAP